MSGVRDILQDRELFHVGENDTVASVVRRMAEIRVGAILVLEGEQLRGVFSERDLMRRVVLEARPRADAGQGRHEHRNRHHR